MTLALIISSIPFLVTAETGGVSITLGLTEICTASKTFLPAKSIAAALLNDNFIPAFSADINARTTFLTSPPAKKCVSKSLLVIFKPAFIAVI